MTIREAAFDGLAERYDRLWSDAPIGRAQRSQVWAHIDPLFDENSFVLDLGCGTGVDAIHLRSLGVTVYGIDNSPRMVEIARAKGVNADCCEIEDIGKVNRLVDGVISNFGALNCVASLTEVASSLARVVRSGGQVALCLLNRVCLWEIFYYLLRGRPLKAFRRFRGCSSASVGTTVFYPLASSVIGAFGSDYRFIGSYGIGLFVPPSYVSCLGEASVGTLATLDRHVAHKPVLRSLSDHRLYILERL